MPIVKKLILYPLLAAIVVLVADISICFVYPDVSSLRKEHFTKTSFMEYREKEWAKNGEKKKIVHKWVPLRKVSPYLVKAVIIAEDDKFWRHEGFDFKAMERALQKDLKKRKFKAGGSTITQQLAKNLYLTPSKNPVRKIKEAIYTWRLEKELSKRRIIELYVNAAEWGDGIFGIQAAARHYYGRSASALSAEQAARLASVLPNPRRFDPTGKMKYVLNRSKRIYRIMVLRGIVIPEYEEVMTTPDEPEQVQTDASAGGLAGEADTSGVNAPSEEASNASLTDTSGLSPAEEQEDRENVAPDPTSQEDVPLSPQQ
ncbi:MAG TPA: monofunctional biosynthetic peptidoglycan transglycosylase [Deltaproteobacteria bacterium]|jgi:monofunctional biosynthetic peptidoglycan transglycosylase|nr:monofunctional biosynthetic peptidoglycan transglycosylase [Deltaproteobacteria bacterium]HQI00886.1 monofunctional biosynthetic peptidoglycan transglycosylase [Deltaproteobacteria bacterium]